MPCSGIGHDWFCAVTAPSDTVWQTDLTWAEGAAAVSGIPSLRRHPASTRSMLPRLQHCRIAIMWAITLPRSENVRHVPYKQNRHIRDAHLSEQNHSRSFPLVLFICFPSQLQLSWLLSFHQRVHTTSLSHISARVARLSLKKKLTRHTTLPKNG